MEVARLGRVAGRHEQLAHARLAQPGQHLLEVRAVADEPGRQVRDDRVAGAREPLGERRASPRGPCRGDAVTVTLRVRGEVLAHLRPRCRRAEGARTAAGGAARRARGRSSIAYISELLRTTSATLAMLIYQATSGEDQVDSRWPLNQRSPVPDTTATRLVAERAYLELRDRIVTLQPPARHRAARGRADERARHRPDAAARGGQAARAREPGRGAAAARHVRHRGRGQPTSCTSPRCAPSSRATRPSWPRCGSTPRCARGRGGAARARSRRSTAPGEQSG